jgi:TonB family protein
MKQAVRAVALLFLAGIFLLPPASTQTHAKTGFQPARGSSASGIEYPVNTVAFGAVVLEVTLDESGAVQDIRPVREIASLTEPAVHSVKGWHFKPALMDGTPVPSLVTVAIMFNPPLNPPANPLPPSSAGASGRPMLQPAPPDVVSAVFATYPMTTAVKKGTVVLQVGLGESGDVLDVKPVRDVTPFTAQAVDAVKKWQFSPAEMKGKPVASSIFVAFVFESPLINGY